MHRKAPHGKGNKRGSPHALQPHRDDAALLPAGGSDTNTNKKSVKSSDPTNSLSSRLRDQEMRCLEVTLGPRKGFGKGGEGRGRGSQSLPDFPTPDDRAQAQGRGVSCTHSPVAWLRLAEDLGSEGDSSTLQRVCSALSRSLNIRRRSCLWVNSYAYHVSFHRFAVSWKKFPPILIVGLCSCPPPHKRKMALSTVPTILFSGYRRRTCGPMRG